MKSKNKQNTNVSAMQRIMRDSVELERANIPSIAAVPMENNIFEWHVNIQPTDGVYSGVFFHLIMTFPKTYPTNPPEIKICTPIRHPNIFNNFLCLSMLRKHTSTQPYEGWSSAYSITSILMQLQSFLFAEKIEQDSGYKAQAQLSDADVKNSINICKKFKCNKCNHSDERPYPKVKGPKESFIKIYPTSNDGYVFVQGSSCQTTHTYWVGAYGEFGVNHGLVMYEVYVNWSGDKWSKNNIRGGLCRFGWGTEYAEVCGRDYESFGYGGTGKFSYANDFQDFGEPFNKGDTITCALNFYDRRIYFGKNGRLFEPNIPNYIPKYIGNALLYPILSFKNSRAEFNFGKPKKPIKILIDNGFKTLEEIALEQEGINNNNNDEQKLNYNNNAVDWIHFGRFEQYLWVDIFELLEVQEIYICKFICKHWYKIINKYNIMERNDMYCFYTKLKQNQTILGIGLNIKCLDYGRIEIESQMDLISKQAYYNGCRIGVWGENYTHFLPLIINKSHAEKSWTTLLYHLNILVDINFKNRNQNSQKLSIIQSKLLKNNYLKIIDTVISMMNQIVVKFVMNNKQNNKLNNIYNRNNNKVAMIFCEKAVLGYCYLYHLLLFLKHQKNKLVTEYSREICHTFLSEKNGSNKSICPDLGKFLLYVMISDKYDWSDIAVKFVYEVMVRNVRWLVKDYPNLNSTNIIQNRLKCSFNGTKISRRLVRFQVWFMNNICCDNINNLNALNHRFGRPSLQIRNKLQYETKKILHSNNWLHYFKALNINIGNQNNIDQLLRYSVYRSSQLRYHRSNHFLEVVNKPIMTYIGQTKNQPIYNNNNKITLNSNESIKMNDNFVPTVGWRGPGRHVRNYGIGRGINNNNNNNYYTNNNIINNNNSVRPLRLLYHPVQPPLQTQQLQRNMNNVYNNNNNSIRPLRQVCRYNNHNSIQPFQQ